MRFFQRKTIYGCDARGDAQSAYLTRYTLVSGRLGQLCLHVFYRSDADDLHDHPWNFWTLILWRGYIEQTPTSKRRVWPGMLLYRPAKHRHRVQLINGRKAVTLVLMTKRVRDWGFFTPQGWTQWQRYFREKGC
ncbi:hypothetical protein IAD21_00603 [Abditibacteriota bacterium]|nr:hypothetical protein IAD21_00603 [Abditibacteriota bacterium]